MLGVGRNWEPLARRVHRALNSTLPVMLVFTMVRKGSFLFLNTHMVRAGWYSSCTFSFHELYLSKWSVLDFQNDFSSIRAQVCASEPRAITVVNPAPAQSALRQTSLDNDCARVSICCKSLVVSSWFLCCFSDLSSSLPNGTALTQMTPNFISFQQSRIAMRTSPSSTWQLKLISWAMVSAEAGGLSPQRVCHKFLS